MPSARHGDLAAMCRTTTACVPKAPDSKRYLDSTSAADPLRVRCLNGRGGRSGGLELTLEDGLRSVWEDVVDRVYSGASPT